MKGHVEIILDGHLPFMKDLMGKIVFKTGDERRGVCEVALGLKKGYTRGEIFIQYYYDCVKDVNHKHGHERGLVFWRTINRFRIIPVNIVAKAFDRQSRNLTSQGDSPRHNAKD
jgi:hypothetical protein